jgi:hypothetical protein
LPQLRRWQEYFPEQRLLILESGDFFRHTGQVFDRVLDFLRLPRWQPERFGNRFPGKYQQRMNPATRARLIEYFRPDNERLYVHLDQRFDWDR